MQLMILGDESPRLLRLASQFLLDVAQVHEAELKNGAPLMPAEVAEPVNEFSPQPLMPSEMPGAVPVPPPPPVETPTAPVTASPAPTTAAEVASPATTAPAQLDKRGFPHDPRIHSKEPKLNADGTWRARRGLDNAELERVEAELRAAGYGAPSVTVNVGPGVASVQVPLPPPVAPAPAPVVAGTDAPAAPQVMVPPPPVVPAPVPAGPAPGASAFQVLMQRVSRNAQGLCAPAAIAPTWAKVGVKGWADFFQRPDLIPAMTAELDAMGAV